jgi:glycosyltransferase involved in cell wall biosynthesis
VALEALASGRPVVASRAGALAEIVTDGVDGIVVPRGDREALRRSLQALVDDGNLNRRLAENAKASAARFHPDEVLREVESAYEATLSNAPRQPSGRR